MRIVRGLPGSGKTYYSQRLARIAESTTHIESDTIDVPATVENLAELVARQFAHADTVILDGIFVEAQVILSIYTRVKDSIDNVGLIVDYPTTEWRNDPYKCWMKTVERAAESHPDDSSRRKLIPLKTVMDMWKRWEDVSLPGVGPDTQQRDI